MGRGGSCATPRNAATMEPMAARLAFIEKSPRRVPFMRKSFLLLELWSGAYMLDGWEKVIVGLFVPVLMACAYALWYA